MSLIDGSYFIVDVNAPDSVYSNIQDFISRYEPEILKKLLGLELYRLVIDENVTDQRILDLRDGTDYDVDGELHRWNGLVNEDKISLISYYVFYWYSRHNMSEGSNTGEVQVLPENAQIANISLKISNIWMRFQELYGSKFESTNYESAYGYLYYFETLYPEWIFNEIGSVNAFDL